MKRLDYYHTCPFPKPIIKKKKPLANGYKDKANRFCYYCGTPYAERHEVFPGNNRQNSIRYGFQVDLCHECHEEIQRNITPRAKERNEYWRKYFQKKYETELIEKGISAKSARSMWMLIIGRNYLDDEEEDNNESANGNRDL